MTEQLLTRPRRQALVHPTGWRWTLGAILENCTDPTPGTDCRLWSGARTAAGYPSIQVGGRVIAVHRLICAWSYGVDLEDVPTSLQTRHLCPLPVPHRHCLAPDHLAFGSAKMNAADRFREPVRRVGVRL